MRVGFSVLIATPDEVCAVYAAKFVKKYITLSSFLPCNYRKDKQRKKRTASFAIKIYFRLKYNKSCETLSYIKYYNPRVGYPSSLAGLGCGRFLFLRQCLNGRRRW